MSDSFNMHCFLIKVLLHFGYAVYFLLCVLGDDKMKPYVEFFEALQGPPNKYIRDAKQMEIDQQIAKEYARQMMRRDIMQRKRIDMKIRFRDLAILALPGM